MTDAKKRWVYAVLALAIVGAIVSAILTWQHYSGAHLLGCSANSKVDCAKVNSSEYSEFNNIPIAGLGLALYFLVGGLAVTRLRRGPEKAIGSMAYAFLMSVGAVAFSVFLAYISKVKLETWCVYCVALYAVNVALLVTTAVALGGPAMVLPAVKRDFDDMGRSRPIAFGLIAVAIIAFGVAMWKGGFNAPGGGVAILSKNTPEKEILEAPLRDPGPGGGYAKGSSKPALTIIEFADFECHACRMTSFEIAAFLKRHPEDVRVVFRHYPLDKVCNATIQGQKHPHACEAARASEAAGMQGKFWEYHDALYAKTDNIFLAGSNRPDLSRPALIERAKKLGLDVKEFEAAMDSPNVIDKVIGDVTDGTAFGVSSTPTLFVNGRAISGGRPVKVFETWLEMAKAGKIPQS